MSAPLGSQSLASQSVAIDGRALDDLKRAARGDARAATKAAAQQFEALFLQRVLKSMRDAMPKSGMFDSESSELYTGMLDQQLAGRLAASGTGLAALIEKQLLRQVGSAADASMAAPGGVPAAAPLAATRASPRENRGVGTGSATPVTAASTATDAGTTTTSAAGATSATTRRRDFVTRHWDAALAAERATGIPAKFVLSQAALESGWGRHEIKAADGLPSHNLFGIKAGRGWTGRTVEVVTTEYDNGVAKRVVEKFRAYNNYGEAFRDWAQLLAGQPRYAGVLAQGRDAQGFAQGLQRAGYATDPNYAAKLQAVIGSVTAAAGTEARVRSRGLA